MASFVNILGVSAKHLSVIQEWTECTTLQPGQDAGDKNNSEEYDLVVVGGQVPRPGPP